MENATAIKQRAQALIKRGQFDKAMAEYDRLVNGGDVDPGTYILVGDLQLKQGNQDAAIQSYTEAAQSYETLGLTRNAIAVLKKILRVDNEHGEAHDRLARLFEEKGLFVEAFGHYLDHAAICVRAGEAETAIGVFDHLDELVAPNARLAIRVADMLVQLDEKQRAVRVLQRRARELEDRGRGEQASTLIEHARTIDPDASAEITDDLDAAPEQLAPPAEDEQWPVLDDGSGDEVPAGGSQPEERVLPGLERSGGLFAPVADTAQPTDATSESGGSEQVADDAQTSEAPAEDERVIDLSDVSGLDELNLDDLSVPSMGDEVSDASDTGVDQAPLDEDEAETVFDLDLARADADASAADSVADAPADPSDADDDGSRDDVQDESTAPSFEAMDAIDESDVTEVPSDDRSDDLDSLLETAELKLVDGLWEEARRDFEEVLRLDPENELAARRLERLAHVHDGGDAAEAEASEVGSDEAETSDTGSAEAETSDAGSDEAETSEVGSLDTPIGVIDLDAARADIAAVDADGEASRDGADLSAEIEALGHDGTTLDPASGDPTPPSRSLGPEHVAHILDRFVEDVDQQLGDDDHASRYDLALAFVEMGLDREAIDQLEHAKHHETFRRRSLELLATCYSRLDQPDRAAESLRDALASCDPTDPSEADLRVRLSTVLSDMGDTDEARSVLRELVDQHPEHEDAQRRLEALGG